MTVTGFQDTLPVRFRPESREAGLSGLFMEKTNRIRKKQRITAQDTVKTGVFY